MSCVLSPTQTSDLPEVALHTWAVISDHDGITKWDLQLKLLEMGVRVKRSELKPHLKMLRELSLIEKVERPCGEVVWVALEPPHA